MNDEEKWNPEEEEGLTPSQVVAIGRRLMAGATISLERDGHGFRAFVDGRPWCQYGILTELLEDLGRGGEPR